MDILLKLIREGKIDMNMIYNVPKEETEKAEAMAAKSGEAEEAGKKAEAGNSVSPETGKAEEGGKA